LLDSASLAGQVLVAGGFLSSALATAEIFNPISNTFRSAGSLHFARLVHTGTLLNDGMVLIAGGENKQTGTALAPAELFDPNTARFAITGNMNFPRVFHTATRLPSGLVLMAGGTNNVRLVSNAELFVP
ncbi:MAG TPA: kelch repeat-containing protein, partial [Candidatus Binataceae bacterium]